MAEGPAELHPFFRVRLLHLMLTREVLGPRSLTRELGLLDPLASALTSVQMARVVAGG